MTRQARITYNHHMTPLAEKVYTLLQKVPRGRVTTYKALANALGTRGYRAIGQILRNNPYAPQVPCHRVIASDGSIGGFMGKTTGAEIQKKIKMLAKEGVVIRNRRIVAFEKLLFTFHTSPLASNQKYGMMRQLKGTDL